MSYAPGKYYVCMHHVDYLDAIRKFIADEALPVEIISDSSEYIDIVTWIQERRLELRALFMHTDLCIGASCVTSEHDEHKLDHTKIECEYSDPFEGQMS